MQYDIHEDNLPRLMKKLVTIQNKCAKYGCEFKFETVGETFKEVTNDDGSKSMTRYITVDTEGTAKMNDWEFIATIQHMTPVNVVRAFNTEHEVPSRYYTAEPVCEHCGSKRNRRDTYLVRNTVTGEFKQVGRSCLKDFTNGLSAEAIAQYISWFDEIIKGEAPEESYKVYDSVEEVVQYAIEAIRLYGYSKTRFDNDEYNRNSTKDVVLEQIHRYGSYKKRIKEDGFDADKPDTKKLASDILTWIRSYELKDSYGYMSNLKAVCTPDYCETRNVGMIVSVVTAYRREVEKAQVKANARENSSDWVGEIGGKIQNIKAECKLLTSWDTMYGTTYMYKFTDENGNIYVWKTGKWLSKNGSTEPFECLLNGTIKAHSEFNGTKQTELTRCKVA